MRLMSPLFTQGGIPHRETYTQEGIPHRETYPGVYNSPERHTRVYITVPRGINRRYTTQGGIYQEVYHTGRYTRVYTVPRGIPREVYTQGGIPRVVYTQGGIPGCY